MGRVPFDVYTMDRLEWFRQEEREKNILASIREYQNDKIGEEKILIWLMNIFQLSYDEATAYIQKPRTKEEDLTDEVKYIQ